MELIFNVFFLILVCLIGGLLILVGGSGALAILLTVWKGFRTHSWPIAFGRVVSRQRSEDEEEEETQEVSQDVRSLNAASEPPKFVYEYEVEGKRFTASAVQYRGNARSTVTDRIEQDLCSPFQVGESVTVYYNSANPEEALLKPGVPAGLVPLAVAGAVLFSVGLAIILIFSGAVKFRPDPRVFSVCLFIPGLALFLYALRMLWTVVASRDWPTTEARVLRSTVLRFRGKSGGYQPSVAYQYVIDGKTYTGTALDWGRFFNQDRDAAQRVVDGYSVGKSVTVHYDPQSPHHAVIEPRGILTYSLVLLFSFVFTVAGIVVAIGAR